MNNQFDELTKSMAQSVTRRAALKKFGVGLAGMALACFGLTSRTKAAPSWCDPDVSCCCKNCNTGVPRHHRNYFSCVSICRLPLGCK